MREHSFLVKDDDGLTLAIRDMTSEPTKIVYVRTYAADEVVTLAKDIRSLMVGDYRPISEWPDNEIDIAVADAKETFVEGHDVIEGWYGADSEVALDEDTFIMREIDSFYWDHPDVFLASMNETTLEYWGERISDEAESLCKELQEMGATILYYEETVVNS